MHRAYHDRDGYRFRVIGRCGLSHGFALVSVLLLLVLLATSVTAAMMVGGLQTRVSRHVQQALQATYLAEAGIQQALYQLRQNVSWRAGIADTALGAGTYNVAVSQPVPDGDISLVATGKVDATEHTLTVTLRTIVITVAGTGTAGYNGDGMAAMTAQLDKPSGLLMDADGNLFIADRDNHRVRRLAAGADGRITGADDELISTVAGTGVSGYNGDGMAATSAKLDRPVGLAFDADGNLFIADRDNERVRRVAAGGDGRVTGTASETISTVAGTGSGGYSGDLLQATLARLHAPEGLVFDADGNLLIADRDNDRVRRVVPGLDGRIRGRLIDLDELIYTVVGTGSGGYNGDGLSGTLTELHKPSSVLITAQGELLIADRDNNRIRSVDPGGDGRISGAADEFVSTIAGDGSASFGGDGGAATNAKIQKPVWVVVDAQNNLFVADRDNNRIRRVVPGADAVMTGAADELMTTYVGTGNSSDVGSGAVPTATNLKAPQGVLVDVAGNLFIADMDNHRVRRTRLQIVRWEGA